MATMAMVPPIGNRIGQIPVGRFAPGRVMAADKVQRADQTALAAAIAQAAFDPALALAEERQQLVQNFGGFCRVASFHDRCSRSVTPQPNTGGAVRRNTRDNGNAIDPHRAIPITSKKPGKLPSRPRF
jgi:hypothetical protein